jgi:hypothetical protein
MDDGTNKPETPIDKPVNQPKPKKVTFKEQYVKDQKKTAAAIQAFDIDDFTGQTEKTYTVQVDEYTVKYQLLSSLETRRLKNTLAAKGVEDLEDQGLAIIAEMMRKADGKTTTEKLNAMPAGLGNKIQNAISVASGFL